MSIFHDLLKDVPIPKMARVRQLFEDTCLLNVEKALYIELEKSHVAHSIKPGMEIAVAIGSRGMDELVAIAAFTVKYLKQKGARPFIVPSMGSHGGATAEGQLSVLSHLGITINSVGAEIRSSMEVDQLGELPNGLPVYIDRYASHADGIVVINRVKPHTAFRGTIESGIMKMISIGLGKQKGAEATHRLGFKYMAENVSAMAKVIMSKRPVLFGIATVENAFDKVAKIAVLTPEQMEDEEIKLQQLAKRLLPKICFDDIDVLVIDEIGKDISGDGMDPNITGRFTSPYAHGGPNINTIVVLDLTEKTGNNAFGIGGANITTRRLVDKMNPDEMYVNATTTGNFTPTNIPPALPSDRLAIQAGVKSAGLLDYRQIRLVHIQNTLVLSEIGVSEALLPDVHKHIQLELLCEPSELLFNKHGNLR